MVQPSETEQYDLHIDGSYIGSARHVQYSTEYTRTRSGEPVVDEILFEIEYTPDWRGDVNPSNDPVEISLHTPERVYTFEDAMVDSYYKLSEHTTIEGVALDVSVSDVGADDEKHDEEIPQTIAIDDTTISIE